MFEKQMRDFAALIIIFLISFSLTYNILDLPSLVIGDNFYWTQQNVQDLLGLKIFRESYLGDIALISTFKSGFLYPLVSIFNVLRLPVTIVYPFLFYAFSMLSFYTLSSEFLESKVLRILLSAMYVINPVTPYYFTSLLHAFTLVFLPPALKFFVKTLRNINESSKPRCFLSFMMSTMFLSLSVSAHEQFILSFALIAIYIMSTFLINFFRRYGLNSNSLIMALANMLLFLAAFLMVNAPTILSFQNIQNAPLSTYYKGSLRDFLANVKYTYSTANLATLLRLGGDSGTGLGNDSWYDSNLFTNLFGYVPFLVFIASIFILVSQKDMNAGDKIFFYMNAILFLNTVFLIEFVKYLPNDGVISKILFNALLQTWESPVKLRVVLLLSILATSFVFFQKLETYTRCSKRKILMGAMVVTLILSTVIYNSPWLINYAGYTPLQQISDVLKWGKLYDDKYSKLMCLVDEEYSQDRGIIVPYTHKVELYVPPKFRVFQLVSTVNDQMKFLAQRSFAPLSKILGLLSIKYLILNENYDPNEILIFPKPFDESFINEVKNDAGFNFKKQFDHYEIFENQNALPLLYSTEYFVFYDYVSTLKYAVQMVDFKDLPVFLGPSGQINKLIFPEFVGGDLYRVYALSPLGVTLDSNFTLLVTNGKNSRELSLCKEISLGDVEVFSAFCNMSAGDVIEAPYSDAWSDALYIDSLILNSTSFILGNYGSFTLNFRINILKKGESSFLSPRVILDVDGSKKYFLIFHYNGVLELAFLEDDVFHSGVISSYVGYRLESEGDFIHVIMSRIFDEIQVYINDELAFSFPIEAKVSTILLSAEQSLAKFTNIEVKTRKIVRLFAARQVSNEPSLCLKESKNDRNILLVSKVKSDFALVSQYLFTPLREIETQATKNEMNANVFFKAWIIRVNDPNLKEIPITIYIKGWHTIIGLSLFSMVSTHLTFIVYAASKKGIHEALFKLLEKIKSKLIKGLRN